MTLQVEFWTVVSFLLTFMGFVGGLAKWLFSKTEERQAARMNAPALLFSLRPYLP